MNLKKQTIRLSSLDLYFLAMEDIMPAQGITISLRFTTRHSTEEMYRALRHMVAIYPRLRSIVQPVFYSYRMKILDNQDERVDVLFRDAFRVRKNLLHDSDEFLDCRKDFFNEPFTLEQTLPIKITYLPDDPQPVLLMSIHHIVGDGMSILEFLNAIMDFHNGKALPEISIYNPSLFTIFMGKPAYRLPQILLRSYKWFRERNRKPKPGPILNASARPTNYFGPCDVYTHRFSFPLSLLRSKAKELGATLTNLMVMALCIAFSRGSGKDKGEVIGIRIPLDHRTYFPNDKPVFGNYAIAPMIEIRRELWDKPREMLLDIQAQMSSITESIQQKTALIPYLIDSSMIHLLGRKFYGWAAMFAKERGLISKTASLTNLGNLDVLNSHGPKAQVSEFYCNMSSYGLFFGISSLNDNVFMVVTYQDAEFGREDIRKFIDDLEQSIHEILAM
jgi:NRPS condensation-like uncharacterized protein